MTVAWRLLILVAALWAVMSLTYPFGWDQGILSWAGGVVLNGGQPYRDAWDMKGPLAYYVFVVSQALFGVNLWGVRVLDALMLAGAAVMVGRAVSIVTDTMTARWSALVLVLWYASQSYWHTAQPDGWVAMMLAACVLRVVVAPATTAVAAAVLAGAAIGATALIKPIYLTFMVVPLTTWWIARHAHRMQLTAACLGGAALTLGACALWFASHDVLDDLIDVYLRYPAQAYADVGAVTLGERIGGVAEFLFLTPTVVIALPVLILGAVSLVQTRRPAGYGLVGWLVLVIALVALQGRFFAYHWLPIMPVAVVIGAVGMHALVPRAKTLAGATLVLVVASCLAPIAVEQARFLAWLTARIDRAAYYDGYGEPGNDMRTLAWLQEPGRDGRVFVFGWNTGIAWLAEREIVSRFGFSMPLLLGERLPVRAEYRDELLRALEATPPRYVIVGTQSANILRRPMTIKDFPELDAIVRTSYVKAATFGHLEVYERAQR